jgi:phosphoribosylaminoimidazolecarboxamide formyltransferase/IMP cyclohydrolase
MKKIKKALISVSDKKNLNFLLKVLAKHKIQIISSGGTYKEIKKLGFESLEISKYTGTKEILGGRVKTLHPKIHAGILSVRKNKSHFKDIKKNNFEEIDLVIVNFYPFEKTLENTNNHNKIIENIDVGGPTMVRAAAKNYTDVTVITNSDYYLELSKELNLNKGKTTISFRQKMSEIAFTETAYYDAIISNYFNSKSKKLFPKKKIIFGNLIEKLRYGENPHQDGAIYSMGKELNIKKLNGKQLSYNNYNDIFSALLISKSLPKNIGTVILKHTNPCGVSINKDNLRSYKLALSSDPISAFGGIVSCNFKIKKKLALEIKKIFLEVVICNGIENEALKILKSKKNLRIIDASNINNTNLTNISPLFNSFLSQNSDTSSFIKSNFKVVSKKRPNAETLKNLIFAFNVCRYVKSNAIVIVNKDSTIGIGSGQPSRLDSCEIAINKMRKFYKENSGDEIISASDAFFPFVDGIEKLVQAGVSAVIQPAGSIRDKEIIKFANQTNTILVFSKTRHFKH